MKNLQWPGGRSWLSLSVIFIAGLFVGVLLGRISGNSRTGDLLTGLAIFVLGLVTALTLVVIGRLWAERRQAESAADSTIGSAKPLVSQPVPPLTPGARPLPPRPVVLASPVLASESTPAVAQPSTLETVTTLEPLQAERHAQTRRLGKHLAFIAADGKWSVRLENVAGYESLQIGVGLNREWFPQSHAAVERQDAARQAWAWVRGKERLGVILFALSLVVYAITRLFALDQFPINFFADEAVQVVNATELVQRGFRDAQGSLFPVYFNVFFFTNPDISVYLHVLTATLFGKSIVVARATSAILTLLAAGALGLLMRQVFQARYWWAVVLLLAATPVWFQHSRTTFDSVAMAALYGLFIVFYLLYRYRSPRYLYVALFFAATTFYAYPSGQFAIGLLSLFLLIADFRYHIQHPRTLLWSVPLVLVLAIPFIRFELLHPDEATYHLQAVNSYWLYNIPLMDKLGKSAATYVDLLSPAYWFLPNDHDLMRHRMGGYSFLPLWELPLLLIGIILAVRRFKDSKYRTVLVALLVAPAGAAVADIGILRALAFVLPSAIISAIGLEWLFDRIRVERMRTFAAVAVFALVSVLSLAMLQDALAKGPTWFSDYTLYGMQWGTRQLFQDTIPQLLVDNPDSKIYVSNSWANGSDIFLRFYDIDPTRVQMLGIDNWIQKKQSLDPNDIFIMTPDEYDKASTNNKFKNLNVADTIKYPDGRDGFYIAQLEYADNVDDIFAQELAELHRPITDTVTIDGQSAQVTHTRFDIGHAQDMFDGDLGTVARGVEANPLLLDIKFDQPRTIHSLAGNLGRADYQLRIMLYSSGDAQPIEYDQEFDYASSSTELPAGPLAEVNFDRGPETVSRVQMEIQYPHDDQTAHVHIFELKFK